MGSTMPDQHWGSGMFPLPFQCDASGAKVNSAPFKPDT
jgi:hypothetical protein